jgi:general secretion pathway protein B
MSLILDALKKSEAERQRQSGPTLLEVRVSQPRRRYPTWVIAVGALLAVNIVLLLAFVLHRPAASPPEDPQTAASPPAAASPAATVAPATNSSPLPGSVAPMAVTAVPPAAAQAPAVLSEGDTLVSAPRTFSPSDAAPEGQDGARNPADDAPAVSQGSARLDRETASHYAGLPSFNDVGGDLPTLRLDLHVFAARARDRYALINMHRVQEGDALPEGPRILAITREGVALDYRGQEFMLRPQ